MSGFTHSALEDVATARSRPVLLLDGGELDRAIDYSPDIRLMLERKLNALVVRGEVVLDSTPSVGRRTVQQAGTAIPPGRGRFVLPDGRREDWLACRGGFGPFTFSRELPDIDWVPASGHGVTVDLPVAVANTNELLTLVGELAENGWITSDGRWCIHQAETNWHGSGADTMSKAVTAWRERSATAGRIHHTEELCYQDRCVGGFFVITADIDAGARRRVWWAAISLQLQGVPLDFEPLHNLCRIVDADSNIYGRPRGAPSTETFHLPRDLTVEDPIALIVDDAAEDPLGRSWVGGLVARNPYFTDGSRCELPENDLTLVLRKSEVLLADLASWHPLDEPRAAYELRRGEWAWTSDGLVARFIADWLG